MLVAEGLQLGRAIYGVRTGKGAISALSRYIGGFSLNCLDGLAFHLPGLIGSILRLACPAKPADKQA